MVNQARMPPSEKMHPRKQSLEQGQKKQAPHQTHRQWHSSSPTATAESVTRAKHGGTPRAATPSVAPPVSSGMQSKTMFGLHEWLNRWKPPTKPDGRA